MTHKVFVVTGSSGFIGSNLLDFMSDMKMAEPFDIVAIDKKEPDSWIHGIKYITQDLSLPSFKYDGPQPDAVIHLAGYPWSKVKGDQGWLAETDDCFQNNTVATYNVLSKIRPKKIIFSSTANLYGEGRKLSEESKKVISSPYGYTKVICEEEIRKSGIEYVIFRFGTVVGKRGRTFPSRLIYSAIHNLPIELFFKGEVYRDLISVDDICRALTSALFFPNNNELKWGDNTYNVSMGIEIVGSVLAETVAKKAKEYGYELKYTLADYAPKSFVKESTLSIDKIRKQIGWKPQVNLEQLIDTLFKYYEEPDAKVPPKWEDL